MRNRYCTIGLIVVLFVIVSGCGQKQVESSGQSFGSIVSPTTTVASAMPSSPVSPKETSAPVSTTESPATSGPDASAVPTTKPTLPPSPSPQAQVSDTQSVVTSPKSAEIGGGAAPKTETKPVETKAEAKPTEPVSSPNATKNHLTNEIKWGEFFDTAKQDTPSNKFWDMNGKTVQIKGFMGEVLSFEKHWFLLIPQPGAECPFDNGDETYWNQIMIVYVPDAVKLRYTSGPLLITGKLDVGIKLDESGYKTMFRLYNASFEKIKE
ncbi:hypothetical protein [Paenibacillus qinlingensis]|uniref:Lipoprotein n=1 Tax=Paenibacillus qinlingensis TaxID=1837343 RepID=A0ABU1NUZ7_9BACL|nr:hypothetical protein [Paenibacillus qinlingensis]MDR6551291.1 hypothetical protein [Paenibacillus qinlingensis]